MRELLLEILGWLGYLERPTVLLQLTVVLVVMIGTHQARLCKLLLRWPAALCTPLGLSLIALSSWVLAALGLPYGLALLLGILWLGWYGLHLLNHLLKRWLPEERVHQLNSRLLRPAYLLVAALALISEVDSLNDLAVAPLGEVSGVTISAGKLFQALLVIYLVLVGCGPPAVGLAWLMQRAVGMSEGSRKAMELMLRYAVVGIGLVAVAVDLGLNTTALIAVAGGLSVGLGFGIKEVFSNFVSGIWLLFEGSVRPGEVLMLDGDPARCASWGCGRPCSGATATTPNS